MSMNPTQRSAPTLLVVFGLFSLSCSGFTGSKPPNRATAEPARAGASPAEVLTGLQRFYKQTARPDGSFQPGIDPDYMGMSDSAYSNIAPVAYAVIIHRTLGWTLPYEAQT